MNAVIRQPRGINSHDIKAIQKTLSSAAFAVLATPG
jgi:hypothetical protein